jgi:hypothetical protein
LRRRRKFDASSFAEVSSFQHDESNIPLTTFTRKYEGALDHIFLRMGSNDENTVLGSLLILGKGDFTEKEIIALSSDGHPSDHRPVAARISLALLSATCLREEPVGGRVSSTVDEESAKEQSMMTKLRDLCYLSRV